ncbi:MAG: nitroreductase [Confluentimicrobium sp.]|nr:nitroreductase [Actibacterium sp.]MBF52151.1 nitroreductase [Actibacterium sp.]OWU68460.1 nitroreductase [Roseovarius sp. 22II1-1F6A]|tara:strand:- start:694 stop:1272 length:579 start_codon:yes stop_codon:yes gene_type:complete
MPDPNPSALEFLLNRRSRPAKTLSGPAPDRAELGPILAAAARCPDHGKLEPWRFVVLERPALERLAELAATRGAEAGLEAVQIDKGVGQFAQSPLAIVVIAAPVEHPKVPWIEQILSSGAVCLGLLNAALASGWGANWLTGWVAHDRPFAEAAYGLKEGEIVAGIIHVGTENSAPPERPRPDISAITTWIDA